MKFKWCRCGRNRVKVWSESCEVSFRRIFTLPLFVRRSLFAEDLFRIGMYEHFLCMF